MGMRPHNSKTNVMQLQNVEYFALLLKKNLYLCTINKDIFR